MPTLLQFFATSGVLVFSLVALYAAVEGIADFLAGGL